MNRFWNLELSHSLKIHQVKTKEIMIVKVFGYLMLSSRDFSDFISPFSFQFWFPLRRSAKHSRQCLTIIISKHLTISSFNCVLAVWKWTRWSNMALHVRVQDVLNHFEKSIILLVFLKSIKQCDFCLNVGVHGIVKKSKRIKKLLFSCWHTLIYF